YVKKFNRRHEFLRHLYELKIIKRYAFGNMCDCSIGIGRFIGKLPKVKTNTGMDISQEFLDYVSKTHPETTIFQHDMRKPFPQETAKYDTVLCLRTIFALSELRHILTEMHRICKPNGYLIIDYPRKRKEKIVLTKEVTLKNICDISSPDEFFAEFPDMKLVKKIPLDMFFSSIKTGKVFSHIAQEKSFKENLHRLVFFYFQKYFNSARNRLPNSFWLMYERLSYYFPFLALRNRATRHSRFLYIYQKKNS
ncbi:MAG: methyltransferase domain-containing protein, partial [Rickettsiales bacterium]